MSAHCDTLTCFQLAPAAGCKCAHRVCDKCRPSHKCEQVPHGTLLGSAHGVESYYCNLESLSDDSKYDHLHYVRDNRGQLRCSGEKWQAMEYARRWWIKHLDVNLVNVQHAHELAERNFIKRLSDGARVDLQFHEGGGTKAVPAVHDLILWKQTEALPLGHVAVVAEVADSHVYIAEQNADNVKWTEAWSRRLQIVRAADGTVSLEHRAQSAYGWLRVLKDNVLPPITWKAPDDDRTAVDGDYGMGTVSILQKFLGIHVSGKHDRRTDCALAAFLNTHTSDTSSPHVSVGPEAWDQDRTQLIARLQQFLNEHPLISGAGTEGIEIKEDGVWDTATTKGVQNLINRVTHADEFAEAAQVYKSGGGPPPRPNLPHGTLLGDPGHGVKAYNCNYTNMASEEEHFDMLNYVRDARGHLQYSGMKWQCVEYARRWWITHFDVTLLNIPRACDIWNRTYAKRLADGKDVALEMLASGVAQDPPRVGDLIIWKKTEEQPVGHVAVVTEVTGDSLRIGEQNVDNNLMWAGGTHSREFPLQRHPVTGAYILRDDEDPLFGWVRVHPDRVVDNPPWHPPATPTLAVDGVMGPETTTAWQKFVGVDVKGDLGDVDLSPGSRWHTIIVRMTDYAAAAFLNVAHQQYPHVCMQSFMTHTRQPIIKKLQNFLNSYPALTGAGPGGIEIVENGEWDEATTKAVQNLLNKVDHYEDFEAAAAYFSKQ